MQLVNFIKTHLIRADGKINTAVIRQPSFKNSSEFIQILTLTSFLPESTTVSPRLWCVLHNITTPPLCKVCGAPAVFLPLANRGYSDTCSSSKCKSLLSSEKAKQTKIAKYGSVASPKARSAASTRSHNLQVKGRATMLERYGVSNPSKIVGVQIRKEQTCLSNYGVHHPLQSDIIQLRKNQTCQHKYGVSHYSQSVEAKQQTVNRSLQQFGTNSHMQRHNPEAFKRLQDYEWLHHHYIELNKPAAAIADELGLTKNTANSSTVCRYLRHHGFVIRKIQSFSHKAVSWLDCIATDQNIHIQHALCGGEYRIPFTNYSVDGFCKETNTVYEFHGDRFHGNPNIFSATDLCHPFDATVTAGQLLERTTTREQIIRSLGYTVISIWESDYIPIRVVNTGAAI